MKTSDIGIRVLTVIFLSIFASGAALRAETIELTLEKCVQIAREKSFDAREAKSRFTAALESYKATIADYYPKLDFSGSAPGLVRAINPITQPDGSQIFRPQSQLFSYSSLNLSQKIPLTGGQIKVGTSLSRIDLLGNEEYGLWKLNPLQITFEQPLFKVNSMKWDRKIAEKNMRLAKLAFVRDMEETARQASNLFFDVFIAKSDLNNARLNAAINDTLYVLSQGRYKVGTIAENDLLQSELELANAKNSLKNAELAYEQAVEKLKLFLDLPKETEIIVKPPTSAPKVEADIRKAERLALASSVAITNLELSLDNSERSLEFAKSRNSFNASLNASYGLNQSASRFADATRDLLDQEQFNLSFSVPIFQWGKSDSEIESALAQKKSSELALEKKKRELKIEIKYITLDFLNLRNRVAIDARSKEIAERRFEVAKNRYIIGKIDMNALFIAQREKDAALTRYIQTLKSFWSSYYNLRKLTMYDFIKNEPVDYENYLSRN